MLRDSSVKKKIPESVDASIAQELPFSALTNPPSPIEVYIVYAQTDERHFLKIKEQLQILQRQKWPISCHQNEITNSTAWRRSGYLATAHLILLLVSPTFLNSDFCYSSQMQAAVERHRTRSRCFVIPILLYPLHPLLLARTPFAQLDFLPTNGKPISTWKDSRKAYKDIMGYLLEKMQHMVYYP